MSLLFFSDKSDRDKRVEVSDGGTIKTPKPETVKGIKDTISLTPELRRAAWIKEGERK